MINQFDKNDYRYKLLDSISRDIEFISSRWIRLKVNDVFSITIFPREEYESNEVDYVYVFLFICKKKKCYENNLCGFCKACYKMYGALNRLYDYKVK